MTQNIWFTSDEHYHHANVIKYCNRPFSSVEEMDEEIVKRHNEVVKFGDLVYHLGDLQFGKWKESLPFLSRLTGTHFLIIGNHDPGLLVIQGTLQRWSFQYRILELKLAGHFFTLSHYPLESWYASFHGGLHLHGHCHGTIPFDPLKRRLDVGVDPNNFTPIHLDEVLPKLLAVPTPKSLFSPLPQEPS